MNNKKNFADFFAPIVFLLGLFLLIGYELNINTPPNEAPIPQNGLTLPAFNQHNLWGSGPPLVNQDFIGHISLLNVWGAWCSACRNEHAELMKIHTYYHIPIYGLDYKDDLNAARSWLLQHGNPYEKVGVDSDGELGHQLGIIGTPETFLLDKKGRVRYRHLGTLDQNTWANEIYPLILKLRQE